MNRLNGKKRTNQDNASPVAGGLTETIMARPGQTLLVPLLLILCAFAIAYMMNEYSAIYQPVSTTNADRVGSVRAKEKVCLAICDQRLKQRMEFFDGRDLLDRNDLIKQVQDAKDLLYEKLEVDYGKYFRDIFFKEDGSPTPFVPYTEESMKRLKRKLIIKTLSAQKALKQQETNVNGCNCVPAENEMIDDSDDSEERGDRLLRDDGLAQEATDATLIDPHFAKYIWATGGHSASAAHGNLYNESYTSIMEQDIKDIFGSIGIEFEARNYAMGGTPSSPEMASCFEQIFGDDVDFIAWDYGMTDAGSPGRLPHYAVRGALSKGRPAFFARLLGGGYIKERFEPMEKLGMSVFYDDQNLLAKMRDNVPDTKDLNTDQINELPPFVRNFKCDGVIEKGEPFCDAEKYSTYPDLPPACSDGRIGKAPWHPGL
jgi:hypothetical protein